MSHSQIRFRFFGVDFYCLIIVALAFSVVSRTVIGGDAEKDQAVQQKEYVKTAELKEPFIGLYFSPTMMVPCGSDEDDIKSLAARHINDFEKLVVEALVPMGINTIIFDMDWEKYHFTCREKLKNMEPRSYWSKAVLRKIKNNNKEDAEKLKGDKLYRFTAADAKRFGDICRANNIDVVVGMNMLSKQEYCPLLKAFPEYGWPGTNKMTNKMVDPLNPQAVETMFDMADELVNAFGATGIHIGLDEGREFSIASHPQAKAKGYTEAMLFAKWINDCHKQFVEKHGLTMYMWTDMFEERTSHLSKTELAINLIPHDIVMCYWQYYVVREPNYNYPWPRLFTEMGFPTLMCPWQYVDAAEELMTFTEDIKTNSEKLKGVLFTTWSGDVVQQLRQALFREGNPETIDVKIRGIANVMRYCVPKLGGKVLPLSNEKLNDKAWDGYLKCWKNERNTDPVEREKIEKEKIRKEKSIKASLTR